MEVDNNMYILIRVVVLVILLTPVFVIYFNKNLRNRIIEKLKRYEFKKVKLGVIVLLVAFALFALTIFYPFESSFIRFDTIDQSIDYSMYKFNFFEKIGSEVYLAEDDNTAFIVNKKGNTYRYTSITKYDDGYGYCGHNVNIKLSTQPTFISTSQFEGAVSMSTVYNKNTNKTCYILNFLDDEFDDNILEIYRHSGEMLNVFANDSGNTLEMYYYIEEGVPNEEFSFVLDEQEFELVL